MKINKNEFNDDMSELEKLSINLGKIKFEKRIHPGLVADSKTTNIEEVKNNPEALYNWMQKHYGHCIMGKWQFLYSKGKKTLSCIKGGVSFGFYEIYGLKMTDPERFENPKKCLARIKELLN